MTTAVLRVLNSRELRLLKNNCRMTLRLSVHAVIKIVRNSGVSGYGGSSGRRVGIMCSTLS